MWVEADEWSTTVWPCPRSNVGLRSLWSQNCEMYQIRKLSSDRVRCGECSQHLNSVWPDFRNHFRFRCRVTWSLGKSASWHNVRKVKLLQRNVMEMQRNGRDALIDEWFLLSTNDSTSVDPSVTLMSPCTWPIRRLYTNTNLIVYLVRHFMLDLANYYNSAQFGRAKFVEFAAV